MGGIRGARPDRRKKVSNLTRRQAQESERRQAQAVKTEFIKREAEARGKPLTGLEIERLSKGRAPSKLFGERGVPIHRKIGEVKPEEPTQKTEITTQEAKKLTPEKQQSQVNGEPPKYKEPTPKSVHAAPYTGKPQDVVETKDWMGAFSQSIKNIGNIGVIGTKGFKAYTEQAFYEPFQDVEKPKAYKKVGTNVNPKWKGTEFGYGMSKEQKDFYTPEGYKNTTDITYFDVLEQRKKTTFAAAGVEYKGEPARLLPLRIKESVVKELKPTYEQKLQTNITSLGESYQRKIDTGELSFEEAGKQYKAETTKITSDINIEFQEKSQKVYGEKMGLVSGQIGQLESYQKKISEPGAYSKIRTTGKVVETGAILGATAYGGSGLTYATSGYIGTKTFKQGVEYKGSFARLTTEQKIVGGASLALGAAATIYTGNLATKRFYSEWRRAIYTDVSRAPAKITGREAIRTDSLSGFQLQSFRRAGTSTAVTYQKVNVFRRGSDQLVMFGKGKTYTRIFDPETMKYITTKESFRTAAQVPTVRTGDFTLGTREGSITFRDVSSGWGQGVYTSKAGVKEFQFVGGAKEKGMFYKVSGGADPRRTFNKVYTTEKSGNIRLMSDKVRGRFDSYGDVVKYKAPLDVNYISSSGSKTTALKQIYDTGAGASAQVTTSAQNIKLANLAKSEVIKGTAVTAPLDTTISKQSSDLIYSSISAQNATLEKDSSKILQTPVISTQQKDLTKQVIVSPPATTGYVGTGTAVGQSPIQSQAVIPTQTPVQVPTIPTPTIGFPLIPAPTPPSPTPYIPKVGGYIDFDLSPGASLLPTKIWKGGKRQTRYSPSFTALVYNIRGMAPTTTRRTGLSFRPITPGFKFKTGLDFNIKKMKWRF